MYAHRVRRSGEPIQFGVRTTPALAVLTAATLAPALCACGSSSDPALGAGGPADEIRAVARAAEGDDAQDLERLIQALDSDDPAERMLAIAALNRLTGLTFGYDFAASRAERRAAIGRWVEWWRAERAPETSTRADQPGTEMPAPAAKGDGA